MVTDRADVLFGSDSAYFSGLRAQAILRVATDTVGPGNSSPIRSARSQELSSSRVWISASRTPIWPRRKLLLATAENERHAAHAQLSEALGYPTSREFELVEEPMPNVEPLSRTELTQRALRERPEAAAARLDTESTRSFAAAEKSLKYPTVTATAAAGYIPRRCSVSLLTIMRRWV